MPGYSRYRYSAEWNKYELSGEFRYSKVSSREFTESCVASEVNMERYRKWPINAKVLRVDYQNFPHFAVLFAARSVHSTY